MTKWNVQLTEDDRKRLEEIVRKGRAAARVIRRAQTLLLLHERRSASEIASILRCAPSSIYLTRRSYCENGLESTLNEKERSGRPDKLSGKAKAHLIALACSDPPEGRACWTMYLLAEQCVRLELTDAISDESVRRILKKTNSSHGK